MCIDYNLLTNNFFLHQTAVELMSQPDRIPKKQLSLLPLTILCFRVTFSRFDSSLKHASLPAVLCR